MEKLNLAKPFEGEYPITQQFGEKYDYNGKEATHYGEDFGCPGGTEIRAANGGTVLTTNYPKSKSGYGLEIIIGHDNYQTQYAHLSEILVKPNEQVNRGQVIARSGRTGFVRGVTGYHLHFGVKYHSEWIDPEPQFGEKEEEKPAPQPEQPQQNERTYTVEKGDSLWKIADKFYGDATKWPVLKDANSDQIENANLIYPGQVLKIPNI